jgi:hypothetical protein
VLDGHFPEVDGLATWESLDGSGGVPSGEHEQREHALVEQFHGIGGDARIVAAKPDADRTGAQLVMHLVEVEQGLDVCVYLGWDLSRPGWHEASLLCGWLG